MPLGVRVLFVSFLHEWIPLVEHYTRRNQPLQHNGREQKYHKHFVLYEEYDKETTEKLIETYADIGTSLCIYKELEAIVRFGLTERVHALDLIDHNMIRREYSTLVGQQNRIGWKHLWMGGWTESYSSLELIVPPTRDDRSGEHGY